jgi:curved DNA-binding protein CbpA
MNYYKILELNDFADIESVKKSYKKLAKLYHPDANFDKSESEKKINSDKFKIINDAYQHIGDADKKRKYDDSLKNPTLSYGSYYDSSYKTSRGTYNPAATPNVSETIIIQNFSDITEYTKKHTYQYHNWDNKSNNIESINININYESINGLVDIVFDSSGKKHLRIQQRYEDKGNVLYARRGLLIVDLYFLLPDDIDIVYNESIMAFDIIHKYNVDLYDILFEDEIQVESKFNKKYKLKLKKVDSINDIRCNMRGKGLCINVVNPFTKSKSIGNYIFKLNINQLNMDNLEWRDRKKFQKMLKEISKKQ